ncbi:MAG: flagella basal body P-ring formation protein FlgA [Crocinitomicaceae bacterium]
MIHRIFIGILFFSVTFGSLAEETGLDQVNLAVKKIFGDQVISMANGMGITDYEYEVQLNNLDSRLNLSLCTEKLNIELPDFLNFGRSQVKVSCQASPAWALNVPIEIKLVTNVVVLNQPVSKGLAIQDHHLDFKRVNIGKLRNGYYLHVDQVIGKQSKRALSGQTVLNGHVLLPALMVHKGDKVMIMAKRGAMSVKMPGEAMSDGREGKQIRVKNIRSERVIRAKVIDFGLVIVNF